MGILWNGTYLYLKTYYPSITINTIPLKLDSKPFRKTSIVGIIYLVRCSTWMENLVYVQKKNGEIKLSVEFKNLNKALEKDNYPLPSLDEVLQMVNGSHMMSLFDWYIGYKNIMIKHKYCIKITFTTKWGTFSYNRMLFGLMNIRATFQREMHITFKGIIGKNIVIYMITLIQNIPLPTSLKELRSFFIKINL